LKVRVALTDLWIRTEEFELLNLSNGNRLTMEEDVNFSHDEQTEWSWCIFLNIETRSTWLKQPVKNFDDKESAVEYFEKLAAKVEAVEL